MDFLNVDFIIHWNATQQENEQSIAANNPMDESHEYNVEQKPGTKKRTL